LLGNPARKSAAFPIPLHLAVWPLEQGFTGAGLAVISEQDVLGDRLDAAASKTRKAENYLTEAQTLSPGDLVVHVDHGVGRYKGLETVDRDGRAHECLLLEYAGGDRLFLPVENIELLSRYGHEEGLLDRLGGARGRPRRPSSRNASARSPTSSSASPPSASCAPPRSSSRRATCGRRSARASPTRRRTTS
jgi:transcription-repair coupling factor (superfamily II helicase)